MVISHFALTSQVQLIISPLKLLQLNRRMLRTRIKTVIFRLSGLTTPTAIIMVDAVEAEDEAVVEAEDVDEDAEDADAAIIMRGHGRKMGVIS